MLVFSRGAMLAADAASPREFAIGIEWIIECGHAAPPCYIATAKALPPRSGQLVKARPWLAGPRNTCTCYAALVVSVASIGSPSSIGSDGSRDHSFQEPKYIRTSFTPAFFSARNVFEARAPVKQ